MKHSSVDFQTKHESTSPYFPPVEKSLTKMVKNSQAWLDFWFYT